EGAGWPHLETARRPVGARSPGARTTRLLHAPGARSRRAGSRAKRCEVAPLVSALEWESVVCGVSRIDLRRAMAREERVERLIDESGIVQPGKRPARRGKQLLVDGRTDPDPSHATFIPQMWHAPP